MDAMNDQPDMAEFVRDHALKKGAWEAAKHGDAIDLYAGDLTILSVGRTGGGTQRVLLVASVHQCCQTCGSADIEADRELIIAQVLRAAPLDDGRKKGTSLIGGLDRAGVADGATRDRFMSILLIGKYQATTVGTGLVVAFVLLMKLLAPIIDEILTRQWLTAVVATGREIAVVAGYMIGFAILLTEAGEIDRLAAGGADEVIGVPGRAEGHDIVVRDWLAAGAADKTICIHVAHI